MYPYYLTDRSRIGGITTLSSSIFSEESFCLLVNKVAEGVSHLGGKTLKVVSPYTLIFSLMAYIFEGIFLKMGKSSNRFSSMEALPDLLVDSDLSGEKVMEEESKS